MWRLDALNSLDPRNVGALNTQETTATRNQNLLACRGAAGCIDDVNERYDRLVSDRSETMLTTINAINAYNRCAGGDTGCVAESLVQMQALQTDLKARGVKLEDTERIGLNSYIASAQAALGNGYGALSAAAMGVGGARANEAGNAEAKSGANGGVNAVDAAVATGSPITTRFVNGVTVVDQRTGAIFNGTVDLQPTFDRIAAGATSLSRNDGTVFKNLPDRTTGQILLPTKPPGYCTEYVVPTPGINGAGPQRIVTGQSGEMFYTPDHYLNFIPVKSHESINTIFF
ncbi:ribonuclease domain-containing protein [Variovorax sp. PvP013]|uniref:ribonuclease domain-containing protein n=1 Tax=Variovorax sp. PvP013 TaxID=3156435 RepID=UPI003D22FC4A